MKSSVIINGTNLTEQEVSVLAVALSSLEMEINEPAEVNNDASTELDDDAGFSKSYLEPIARMRVLLGQ